MNLTIWKKALELIRKKKVKFIGFGITRDSYYFEVADVNVDIVIKRNMTMINCTCKHHSSNPDEFTLCSYSLAVIHYLLNYLKLQSQDKKLIKELEEIK